MSSSFDPVKITSAINQSVTQLRRRLRRTEAERDAIREICRSVNANADLRSILNGITQTTTDVLRVDSTSIYLLDPSTQRLILKATTGLYPNSVDHSYLKMGQGLTGWAAQHRQAVAARDAQSDYRFFEVPNTRERSFQSLLAVPLINQDRVIGAINVQTYRVRTWNENDVEFVSIIGDVVAGILERAVLEEQTERRVQELTAVSEVSKAVTAPVYLDETLRVVAEMAAKSLNAIHCSLLLLDEVEKAFVPRAVYDERGRVPQEPRWPVNDLPLINIDSLHEPVIVGDVCQELSSDYCRWATEAKLNMLLCVPMIVQQRQIGIMNVWSDKPVDFNDAQVELATTLANQLGLAIVNAHLVGNAAIVQEMHHRVKNNLQNVVMLLQMQLGDDRKVTAKEALGEAVNRIMSIAAVHDAMAHEGFRLVDVKDVITRVCGLVRANMTRPDLDLSIEIEGPDIRLSSRAATALALCVNELVQNSMEHAFVGRQSGQIYVRLFDQGRSLEVEVRDDGRGSAAGEIGHSLGLSIVEALVAEDLRGHFELKRDVDGSVARITAPIAFS